MSEILIDDQSAIEAMLNHAKGQLPEAAFASFENYARKMLMSVAEEEILQRSSQVLFNTLDSHWQFMQQREADEASGDNWMFFGDQTFTQDFLYQVEWQNYLKSGLLTRMDVAFSRDQAEKIYVQDRLKEQAKGVFAWLERGAHLYICGDMSRMAKDVEATLLEIIAEQGQLNGEKAEQYLKDLRSNKRYQKDVY